MSSPSGSVAIISEYSGTIARLWPRNDGVKPSVARTTYSAVTVPCGVTTVWGSVGPDQRATLSIDGEEMYLILTHPHGLTSGADPKRLAAVWPRDGNSDDRICVWIDPVRSERSGE